MAVCSTCHKINSMCPGHIGMVYLPLRPIENKSILPNVKDALISMIKEKMEVPFVVLFNEHVEAKNASLNRYGRELGRLAIDNGCRDIIKRLFTYYNTMVHKCWLNHAINNDVGMAGYLLEMMVPNNS